jgi:hypothetical protein
MKKVIEFIKATFQDKQQNPSGRELTVFAFVLVVIASWIGQQFLGKPIEQWMFLTFVGVITAGIGLYTIEPTRFIVNKKFKSKRLLRKKIKPNLKPNENA